jgi:acyl dehydratase
MFDYSKQVYWEDVNEGDEVPPLEFPMTMHRLVVHAGASMDFNPIHYNTEVARAQGAPEMYTNNVFSQGMWERTIREFIGLDGVIKKMGPFRMKFFSIVGETVKVHGTVSRKWQEDGESFVEFDLASSVSTGDCVVGKMTVTLPSSQ